MRKIFAVTALAAAISLPLVMGSTDANASCQSRKNTGTIIGGVSGALLGNAIASGGGKTGGTIIGGLGGAVVGHEIAKSGCHSARHAYYRPSHSGYAAAQSPNYGSPNYGRNRVYYDQYGNAVVSPQPYYNR
jgi:surface antigen